LSTSLQELEKAVESLHESLQLYENASTDSPEQKAFRDACIQRFEYGIELSWKVSMKILGSGTAAAKPALREMARNGLVADLQAWFDFIDARNQTSHSYDEAIAKKVFEVAKRFHPEAERLLKDLQKK